MCMRTARRQSCAALLCLLLAIAAGPVGCAGDHSGETTVPERIVFLGDSITDGFTYPLLVRQALAEAGLPAPTVINAGIGGDTAAGMAARLDRDVLVHRPDLVTLSVGINDVLRDVPLDAYEAKVRAILERLRDEGVPVLVMTTSVLGEKKREEDEALADYNAVLRRLAEAFGLDVAEVYTVMDRARQGGLEVIEVDHVHPNYAGHRQMARAVLDALGHPDVPVPETLVVETLPGLVSPWRIRAATKDEPALTAGTVAAVRPDDTWAELRLPETEPLESWWSDQVRRRGFALSLQDLAGPAKRYLARAVVTSPEERTVYLNTGGHLQTAWLNGQQVFAADGWTGYHAGKERLPVTLQKGENVLVLETGAQWFLSLTETNDW
ncbi:MAG: SGNH/GDSL hydrolase family protein [Planctomycetota bacterium]